VGWQIFKDHPLTGIGDVSTQTMYRRYANPDEKEIIGHFHNNYVHIAVTLGVFGISAFLFMTALIFVHLWRKFKKLQHDHTWISAWALAALSVFLAFSINGFFEWNFGDQEIITMVWFCVGLALGSKDTSR
jgi:O-antigen ligase